MIFFFLQQMNCMISYWPKSIYIWRFRVTAEPRFEAAVWRLAVHIPRTCEKPRKHAVYVFNANKSSILQFLASVHFQLSSQSEFALAINASF